MRSLLLNMFIALFWVSGVTVSFWYIYKKRNTIQHRSSNLALKHTMHSSSGTCSNCGSEDSNLQDQIIKRYNNQWSKQEDNFNKFRSMLVSSCHGASKAIVTQANTPLGSKVEYDGEKTKPFKVTPKLFNTFSKEPFHNFPWKTCAVVGNGGILTNSSCGEDIDSAQFIFRCNLPPLGNGYKKDVGNKTNLVTANPSILLDKFAGLMERRHPFVENLSSYGNSFLLLPAFSYSRNIDVSLRAVYTLQDFQTPARPIFLNPKYLKSLMQFWRARGLKAERLSTGVMMASLALELCMNVNLYGFWPFPLHPYRKHPLSNHYYDDQQGKNVHNMSAEFEQLLRLHEQGVVRVHLGKCTSGPR
ncbi:hypothetical protein AGOR_G00094740 [Albula goreensis]|uniref:ST8 alpha-N-acetyl-neuraminide alpha-2,8-sialyltransferase 6 n=1 Tax=Albula goreensis TaxID=1534307 RepID=A0A8T3DJ22_9TELE|nr:hypothetical protein AGOR_G00094740 [Albula goreensis]